MKYFFTYLFSISIMSIFCQVEVEVKSVIFDFKEHFCMEDNNAMYYWKETPDKVLIQLFNQFGDILLSSNEMSVSFNNFSSKENPNLILKGDQLPEGTYFLLVNFEKNDIKKYFKHFIYLTQYCGCG